MAHSTKRPAPEGSRGRDDWMTVIEMQEYMGASIFTKSNLSPDDRMNTTYSAEGGFYDHDDASHG